MSDEIDTLLTELTAISTNPSKSSVNPLIESQVTPNVQESVSHFSAKRDLITGRDLLVKERREQIKSLLRTKAMSVTEVATELNTPYSTMYREMQELIRSYQIHITGATKGKSPLYRCGSPETAPPDLYYPLLSRPVPLIDFIKDQIDKQFRRSNASVAANKLPVLLLGYLELAGKLGAGLAVSKDEVLALRNDFVQTMRSIDNIRTFFEQMIENDKRWDLNELRRIGQLPQHTRDELVELVDAFNSHNQSKNSITNGND